MKKFLSLIALVSLLFVFNSCKDEEELYYEGDSLLNFGLPAQSAKVIKDTGSADYIVTYGVTKAAQSDNTVELVFDAAKSTAVLGTDFTIIEGTDVLKGGAGMGDFKLNVKESAAKAGKTAVFTLKSSSLGVAPFNKQLVVTFTWVCPPTTFPGLFSVKNALFGTYDTPIVLGTAANTIILKDYIETGFDITVNFNPLTGEVSLPTTPQSTGYINGASGVILIKPAIDGTKGTVDFCNKILNLKLSYGTPSGGTYGVGGAGSYFDVFTGY